MSESNAAKPIILPVAPSPAPERLPVKELSAIRPGEPQPAAEPALEGAAEEWAKLRALALGHLERMGELEPRVLRGNDADAVHDFRVASRRFQQALDFIYPPPARPEIRRPRQRIKRCRTVLSDLRNYDVLLKRVNGLLARKRTARRAAWAALANYLVQRRPRILRKAVRRLSEANLTGSFVKIHEWLGPAEPAASAALSGPRDGTRAGFYAAAGVAVERNWGVFQSRLELARQSPAAPTMHRLRIAAKHLRYLVEILREFGAAGSDTILLLLRDLQRLLGQWQDLEVLEQVMIEAIAERNLLRENLALAMDIERLMLKNRKSKQAIQERFFEMARDSDNFRRLERWMSHLSASPAAAFPAR